MRPQQGEHEPVALAEVTGPVPPEHQPHGVPGLIGKVDRHLSRQSGKAELEVHGLVNATKSRSRDHLDRTGGAANPARMQPAIS